MQLRTRPSAERLLLGAGLALLTIFSLVVVWKYFGQGNLVTDGVVVLFAFCSLVAVVARWRDTIRLGFGPLGGAPRELVVGFGIAALVMAGIFCVEWALGAIRVERVRPEVGGLVRTLGLLTVNAAYQEVLFRVLILGGLLALFRRPWVAVGLSAVLFGLVHAANEGATALSVASTALGGVLYGAAFVRSGRIWMPIGLHAAWNWVQGPVFGFPVSGTTDWSDLLVHQVAVGGDLITGGAYGPEGGVVAIAFRFLVIALVILATRRIPSRFTTQPWQSPAGHRGLLRASESKEAVKPRWTA